MPRLRPHERLKNICDMGCELCRNELMSFYAVLFSKSMLLLSIVWLASLFPVALGLVCLFTCVCLSLFQWSVYLSCSPCSCTSSRHAYFLCTWMAIRAALPITIIYIKFEINFTLFSLCNYVNSCCETKLQTWILIAVSFKSLWTLARKTQHYGSISVISSQGFNVSEGEEK